MALLNEEVSKKLSLFNISTTTYKTINNHDITAAILIPKDLQPGKHPLLVRIHGGGFITGSSLDPGLMALWFLQHASSRSAIIVMPNYRLMPESPVVDLLQDLSDFWKWVLDGRLQASISQLYDRGIIVDLSKIWAHGESCGGYLSIQSALTLPHGTLNVVSAAYPGLDFKAPWYSNPYNPLFFGSPIVPESVLDEHLAAMKPGEVISSAVLPERAPLLMVVGQRGRWAELMGSETEVYPMEVVEKANSFPPLFVYHGREDMVLPAEGTVKFVDALKRIVPDAKVVCKLETGDHGFDAMASPEDPWLKEGLELVDAEWLK